MSYQVLARKWRPRSFATMVGQAHVLQALINALDNDRLHHAYLFTGTRGVGKTTVARIFAKALNCEVGVSSTPCGECSACREINEGRFMDLIEVDAASRTKVEDTRELLDNVQYAPTRGRFKVYLIDEVHMLSTHSFNALLKTLEEPPPHVKFLLATTDPQKLPATVLSRCLQFNLKRLSPELIAGHLAYLLKEEKIESEPEAILQLSEAADGSMRDGLSLLDQAIAFGGGHLTAAEVGVMLGSIDRSYIFKLLKALAAADAQGLLEIVHALAEQGVDFSAVLKALNSQLHKLALAQIAPEAVANHSDSATLLTLAQDISAEDVQLYYQIGLNGSRDLPFAPDLRAGFEMIVLRMLAFRPLDLSALSADEGATVVAQPKSKPKPQKQAAPAKRPAVAPPPSSSAPVNKVATPPVRSAPVAGASWRDIVDQLGLGGMAYQLAINSVMTAREGDTLRLSLASQHATLRSAAMERRLQEALSTHFGADIRLKFSLASISEPESVQETPAVIQQREAHDEHQAAVATMNADENVQRICETFDGRVVEDSVKPIHK